MDPLIIPVVALTIPMIVAPVAIIATTQHKKRQLEHIERIRALELGRLLPQDESWWSPPRLIGLIAGFVPSVALGIAALLTTEIGYHDEVWMACGGVGISGVIGGTYIAGRYLFAPPSSSSTAKGQFDPDAYDVVGRRG